MLRCISAVTLATPDMAASVSFYQRIGFRLLYGGAGAEFSSFEVGGGFLNVQAAAGSPGSGPPWGRVIFWVDDVDAAYTRVREAGFSPEGAPRDAPWGERYFHVRDPAGHELSFAAPLEPGT